MVYIIPIFRRFVNRTAGFCGGCMHAAILTAILCLIFLNGATDAANAIAAAVASGALSMRRAALLSAMCNTAGGIFGAAAFPGIASSVLHRADFGAHGECGVLASLLAAVLFTLLAWICRMPTSESHALLASAAGASLILGSQNRLTGSLAPAACWMLLCVFAGFAAGLLFSRVPASSPRALRRMQILSAGAASFLHGAQDLAKFLALAAASGIPAHPALLPAAAAVMGLGTVCGGQRMTDAVGQELAKLDNRAALASDLASAAALAGLSLFGIPASTTHAKTAAVAGCALASPSCRLRSRPLLRFGAAWLLTFPACAALGAALARLLSSLL